ESLAIKVFCDLINSQGYNEVIIWDPHSEVTPSLLDYCTVIEPSTFLRLLPKEAFSKQDTVFVSPDAGANKKVFKLAKEMGIANVVRADKTRDTKTGNLSGTVVYG